MMSIEAETISTIKESLNRMASEYKIEPKAIRLKIYFEGKDIHYQVMNNLNVIAKTDLKKALNLSGWMVGMKLSFITSYLKNALNDFEYECKSSEIDLRLYLEESGDPSGYLYCKDNQQRKVLLKEILN